MLINKVNLLSFCLSSQSKKTFLEILVNSSSDKTNVKLGLFMFETETSASPEPDDVWHSMLTKGRKHDTHWMISTCGTIFLTWVKMVDTYGTPLFVYLRSSNTPSCCHKHVDECAADNEPQHVLPVSRKSQRKLHVRDLFNYYLWGPLHLHMTG